MLTDRLPHAHRRILSTSVWLVVAVALSAWPLPPVSHAETAASASNKITLDFNEVEIPVFVRFISELTGKNFVLDEAIKKLGGKTDFLAGELAKARPGGAAPAAPAPANNAPPGLGQ